MLRARIDLSWVDKGDNRAGRVWCARNRQHESQLNEYVMIANRNHPEATRFVTLLHELAHIYLGHLGPDKKRKVKDRRGLDHALMEIEAESVAYIIAKRSCISPRSESYLDNYKGPYTPLAAFTAKTQHLPRTTEAERLVVQRIGQNLFRAALMSRWNARCPLTGITDPALLRASHIVPWAACETDAERLNPDNGLLLSALWDAAFDIGLVRFSETGEPQFSTLLSSEARNHLTWSSPIQINCEQRARMRWHRQFHPAL